MKPSEACDQRDDQTSRASWFFTCLDSETLPVVLILFQETVSLSRSNYTLILSQTVSVGPCEGNTNFSVRGSIP